MNSGPCVGSVPPPESLATALNARFVVHDPPAQSVSFIALQVKGQQPSPLTHAAIMVPPPQMPLVHVVCTRHALPDLHAAPLFAVTPTQAPSIGSLHSLTWHAFMGARQVTGVPAHVPFVQTSLEVQYFPSLQMPPLFVGLFTQPSVGSHLPTLHVSLTLEQSTGAPVQAPVWHVPAVWHLSDGMHDSPSLAGTEPHVCRKQVLLVQLVG
jgi:hypothetical protein